MKQTILSTANFNVIKHVFSKYPLYIILIFAAIFRLYYYSYFYCSLHWDSQSNIIYYRNIFLGEVDAFRTPVYPYFIKFVGLFSTGQADLNQTPQYYLGHYLFYSKNSLVRNVCYAQCFISFLTIIPFYKIVSSIFKQKWVYIIATLSFVISPSMLNYDKCVLPESLGMCFIVFFFYLFIRFNERPLIFRAIGISSFSFLAIMLRPSFLFLVPLLIVHFILWGFYNRKKYKIAISGIVSCIVCILLVMVYINQNHKQNHVNNISTVANINQIDMVVMDSLYEKGNDSEIIQYIKYYLTVNKGKPLYDHLRIYICDHYSYDRVRKYINTCISSQPKLYLAKRIGVMNDLKNEFIKSTFAYPKEHHGIVGYPVELLTRLSFLTFSFIYILFIVTAILVLYQFFYGKERPWFLYFILAIIILQFITIIFGAQDQYQRLFVIADPLIIILLFYYIDVVVSSLDKYKFFENIRG